MTAAYRTLEYTQHAIRLSTSAGGHAGPSDPLAIRGASRPTAVGRIRRNALSSGTGLSTPSMIPVRVKPKAVDSWREVVQKRWNPETKYLNLDVCRPFDIHLAMPSSPSFTVFGR